MMSSRIPPKCYIANSMFLYPQVSTLTNQPLIVQPNAEILEIFHRDALLGLIDCLELPALTQFTHMTPFTEQLCNSIMSLLLLSAPPFCQLELDNIATVGHFQLIKCLKQCPLLQELSQTPGCAYKVHREFLHHLTHYPRENQCCLVPKLQSFTMSIWSCFSFKAFTKMVESC